MDMICVFNRRELIITCDLREANRIRELLLANRIECQAKVSGPGSVPSLGAGRTRTVSFGMLRRQEQITIYVHKNDWDYAAYLLRNNRT
jgi:hypothetical protein